MENTRRVFSKLASLLVLLSVCSSSLGQGGPETLDESSVKDAILNGASEYVCTDGEVLDFIGVGTAECKRRAMNFADACWQAIDNLVDDYTVVGTESGKHKFGAIGHVYSYCLQTQVLMLTVLERNDE